ncbi:integral membrane, YccS/YhfK family protein [Neisseria meningitidis NM1476]|uniref:YccS family putative transporter n=1 Tax=Neisseria meningitidis TaxID=487 RepID=UPI00038B853A|nr:YccS family putative transporter [Neisseria meningitidis]EQD17849.1 integral membrane, YccS/YhfK family protein [Neisseria meningitidis NM1476]
MKTPLLKPLLITSLPVFASVFTAASIVWQLGEPKLAMPFVLGIIAGGLVDLDNRLTGRLKNIITTVALFTLSSLTAQSTLGTGLPFILAMTLMTFGFTILGAVGLKYRTFAFGALAVATYTTLTYTPETYWLTNPFMILCGTVLYSTAILLFQIVLPHRPVQESVANAYDALGGYLEAKADFFDPDEAAWIGNRHIDLAMSNTGVITAFNQCRSALFYRLRGKHRHPRTAKMLRYYFAAQDIHERISSAHVDYQEMSEKFKNTDIIFRIHRLLEMQGQACRNTAQALRASKDYVYSKRLGRAIEGCRQSLRLLSDSNDSPDIRHLRRLLDNLGSVDQQFRQLQHNGLQAENDRMGDTRIAALETSSLKNTWQAIRPQLNLESGVFRHAVRLSLVVAAACTIVEALNLNLGYWILLTALFVCQPNYTATKSRVRQRIAGTIIGASLAWAAVSYLWPDWKYLTLERTAALAVCSNGAYLEKITERLKSGETGDDVEYRATRRRAHEHTAALSSTLSDMSSEPAKFADSLQPGFTLLKTGYALTGYISALGAYRSEMHEECSPDFTAQFHLAAEHTAHIFQHLPETEPDDFQTALDTLRGELDTLRTHSSGTQSHILLQQLQLIARQLEPYYRAYRQIPHRQPQNAA